MVRDPHNNSPRPPRWADHFLAWYCSRELIDEIQGDLHEAFYRDLARVGLLRAQGRFVADVFRFFRPASFPPITFDYFPAMLQNYFKTALRSFWRQKGYTLINISGLSVGLACSILILLWVQDELKMDQFHEQGPRLYQVMRHVTFSDGQIYTWMSQPMPLAQMMEKEIPEVMDAELVNWSDDYLIRVGDRAFRESGRVVDSAFFDIFTFPLIVGEASEVLKDPASIVISESVAIKYFGPDWQAGNKALGQLLTVNNDEEVKVSGVFRDVLSIPMKTSTFARIFAMENGLAGASTTCASSHWWRCLFWSLPQSIS